MRVRLGNLLQPVTAGQVSECGVAGDELPSFARLETLREVAVQFGELG